MFVGRTTRAAVRAGPRGFTLVESAIAVLLVGLLMIASLRSVGAAKRREMGTVNQIQARQLAAAMLNEILLQSFQEPNPENGIVFGPETGEAGNHRALFDDVDDYAGYVASPPTDRNGTPIPGASGWSCTVAVEWIKPTTFAVSATPMTDLKRITVSVSKQGKPQAKMVGYRSAAWKETIPAPWDATGNNPPVAVATSPNPTRTILQNVTFVGSSSSDPDGDALSYVWNFGNGKTGSGATTTHRYTTPGNYTATLTVYDGRGGVSSAAVNVTITN